MKTLVLLLFVLLSSGSLFALSPFDMSLEELLEVEVISASKRPELIRNVPAAIHVIQAEDIKRSGASNIPEVLRLAPGVEVLAISQNKWSVSVRGGAREYSNKLQVLVDGRSVYSPVMSGVIWEALDVPLENIARIEVIRGPGSSVWGSNAVNGVINIITKPSIDTLGSTIAISGGNRRYGESFIRHGYEVAENKYLRVHARGLTKDESRLVNGKPGSDSLKNISFGFRFDSGIESSGLNFTISGNYYDSRAIDKAFVHFLDPLPRRENLTHEQKMSGYNLAAEWNFEADPNKQRTFRLSYENYYIDQLILDDRRDIIDMEYSELHNYQNHATLWGAHFRLTKDKINSSRYYRIFDDSRTLQMSRLFFNSDIVLNENLNLSFGSGFEYNSITGFEYQPTLSLAMTSSKSSTLWASISRATRTPSRAEDGARFYYLAGQIPEPVNLPYIADTVFADLESERLYSYELGWRKKLSEILSFDLSLFSSRYKSLIGSSDISREVDPLGFVRVNRALNNNVKARNHGLELAVDYHPYKKWRLFSSLRHIQINADFPDGTLPLDADRNVPHRIYSLFSTYQLNDSTDWTVWYRNNGKADIGNISGYERYDTAINWSPTKDLNLTIACKNIMNDKSLEFDPRFIFSQPRELGRTYYLRTEWSF